MRRLARTLPLAALLCLALTPSAQATYEPLGSGATRLALDKGFLALLKQNKVKLAAVAPAKLKAGVLSFSVSAGKFDPTNAKGTVEHEGALLFKAPRGSIPLKALQLKTTQERSPFSVKAGGGQLKLATAQSLAVSRQGFGNEVKVQELTLNAKVATRLAKKLKLRGVFKAGQPLGSSTTVANPETLALLPKGKASFVLAPGIAAKLESLFVALNPIFPAERPAPGSFTLPIAGGTIAPDGSSGQVVTQGSLEALQLGGGQVFWAEPLLDLQTKSFSAEADAEPSPPYAGKVGRVAIAALATASVSADPKTRTVSVSGASLSLDAATAQTFNEVFAKPQGKSGVFVAGEGLGVLSFTGWGE
jgi:hypothetical protein